MGTLFLKKRKEKTFAKQLIYTIYGKRDLAEHHHNWQVNLDVRRTVPWIERIPGYEFDWIWLCVNPQWPCECTALLALGQTDKLSIKTSSAVEFRLHFEQTGWGGKKRKHRERTDVSEQYAKVLPWSIWSDIKHSRPTLALNKNREPDLPVRRPRRILKPFSSFHNNSIDMDADMLFLLTCFI